MSISLRSNLSSLRAQRQLGEVGAELASTFERLSSGQRINRSADDAAGLAIATSLESRARVYTRGIQNLNDGTSLIAIADAALNELSSISIRLIELSEQASNESYSSDQREALDAEAQALSKEYTRIVQTTSFNNVSLFNGDLQGLRLQAGYATNGSIHSSLGGAMGTGAIGSVTSYAADALPYYIGLGDLNNDGNLDMLAANVMSGAISALLGNGDGTFQTRINTSGLGSTNGLAIGDTNSDGVLDVLNVNGASITVLTGNGDGTFQSQGNLAPNGMAVAAALSDINGDGWSDIISANPATASVSVFINNGDGSFASRVNYTTAAGPASLVLGDFNGDGAEDIVTANSTGSNLSLLLGNGDGTFQAKSDFGVATITHAEISAGDVNHDGHLDILTANGSSSSVSIFLGNGNGTFQSRVNYAAGNSVTDAEFGDMNGDGNLDIVTSNSFSGSVSILLGNSDGTFRAKTDYTVAGTYNVELGDLNNDGVVDLASGTSGQLGVALGRTRDGVSPILPFSLQTLADARQSLAPLRRTLDRITVQRGVLGAFQSRIQTATNVLARTAENFRASEARIKDVDIATEAANSTRLKILQDLSGAVLGQANQAPELALKLLAFPEQ